MDETAFCSGLGSLGPKASAFWPVAPEKLGIGSAFAIFHGLGRAPVLRAVYRAS